MAGNIRINSSSGGSVTLTATETASDRILTLPGTAGTLATMDSLTGSLNLPAGTTAQRPASPVAGMMRYNSTLNIVEIYTGSTWSNFISGYLASYVAVAGGAGGGSSAYGQGGGAGGALFNTVVLTAGTTYTITIGSGGAGAPINTQQNGSNGSNTAFGSFASCVGGGANGNAAQGTAGQGYGRGNNGTNSTGGGGGAAQVGLQAKDQEYSGAGGGGIYNNITGTFTYYGGGGGSGGRNQDIGIAAGAGGAGGGGAGTQSGTIGTAGTVNTGGGGGGGTYHTSTTWPGGNGGSGVVFISVPTTNYTGSTTGSPTVTTNGLNTVMKFTASGTYTA
jgi:hypothetical protein